MACAGATMAVTAACSAPWCLLSWSGQGLPRQKGFHWYRAGYPTGAPARWLPHRRSAAAQDPPSLRTTEPRTVLAYGSGFLDYLLFTLFGKSVPLIRTKFCRERKDIDTYFIKHPVFDRGVGSGQEFASFELNLPVLLRSGSVVRRLVVSRRAPTLSLFT